jgi:fibro-slime domain-containing protein
VQIASKSVLLCVHLSVGCGKSLELSAFEDAGMPGAMNGSGGTQRFGGDAQSPPARPQTDASCGANLTGILRDFRGAGEPGGHTDFEQARGGSLELDMVQERLGPDAKPVFAGPTASTSSKVNFDQWFRDVPGVNKTKIATLPFVVEANGHTSFGSDNFFPLDGDPEGFGNTPGQPHDFHFTYELHTQFLYQGGEVFNFRGDDDVWAFLNGVRVVDLGGIHEAEAATVNIDAEASRLGIRKGETYEFAFFFAERHTSESNFKLETTLKFVNCAPILPR